MKIKMKNRFVGVIIVEYPDGYTEKCSIKERSDKGERNFLRVVAMAMVRILYSTASNGRAALYYKGDFKDKVGEWMDIMGKEVFTKNKKVKNGGV